MALANTTDLAQAAMQLATWLRRWKPQATDVQVHNVSMSQANGMSTETVMFDAEWNGGTSVERAELVSQGATCRWS